MDNWEFLEGFSSGYFTLFSPQSGPNTISEQLGTSGWVLVRLWSIQTLPIGRQESFFLFSQNALLTYVVTYIRSYIRKKNQTSKVSLCGKCAGSKKIFCFKTNHFYVANLMTKTTSIQAKMSRLL